MLLCQTLFLFQNLLIRVLFYHEVNCLMKSSHHPYFFLPVSPPNSSTSPRSLLTKTFKAKTSELQKAALPYDPWVVLQGPSNRSSPRSRSQSIVTDVLPPMDNNADGDNDDDDLLPSQPSPAPSPSPPQPSPPPPPSLIRTHSPRNLTSLNTVRSTTETLEHVIHVLSSPTISQHKNKDHCMNGGVLSNVHADSFSKLHSLCSSNSGIEMIRMYVVVVLCCFELLS